MTPLERACPAPVWEALCRLQAAGYRAHAVGGCVRDILLNKTPHDWDVATSALPGEVKAVFAGTPVIPTGEKHGTVTVLLSGKPLEITTYRVDGTYSDSRRPDFVTFTRTLEEDLARRDFTINAMAWSPEEGIIDCFGGRKDLEDRIVRCVGEPDRRFEEDALRILRALRFAAVLDFSIDPATAVCLRQHREQLHLVAAERISAELQKLLCGAGAGRVLREFPEVFSVFLPELEPLWGFDQHTPYHLWDIYEHTIRSVEAVRPDPVLRLTMLLHDIGKPDCYFTDEKGQGHFKGHPAVSAAMSGKILRRLRMDGDTVRRVRTLIQWHDAGIHPEDTHIRRWLRVLGREDFFALLEVKEADNAAQNQELSDVRPELSKVRELAQGILERKECFSLDGLAITGRELIENGIPAGKQVGYTLEELLQAVMEGRCLNKKDVLLWWSKAHPPLLPPDYPRFPQFRIRKAKQEDLKAIEDLWFRLNQRFERMPLNPCGWRNGFYPTPQTAEEALKEDSLWLLENGGFTAGTMILNHKQADAYRHGNWQFPAEDNEILVVHTLCVDTACGNKGAAHLMMEFAFRFGQEIGCKTVRLDAFTGNAKALRLYESLGFHRAGTVDLGLEVPGLKWFRLYEIPIPRNFGI